MEDSPFFTEELLTNMNKFFAGEVALLGNLNNVEEKRIKQYYPLLVSIIDNSKSMSLLGECNLINDMYMIARSYVERMINFMYLQVCDEDEFNSFQLHTIQKAYRRLDRSIETTRGKVKFAYTGKDSVTLPNLDEALNRFTSKSGKEITHWTPVPLDKRIEIISERTNINSSIMMMCKLNIYEDASEALHGTLYGSLFHLGVFSPGTKLSHPNDLVQYYTSLKTTIYWTCGLLTDDLFALLNEKYSNLEGMYIKSKEYTNKAVDVMKKAAKYNEETKRFD
ncbi:hypothetical protein A8L34_12015 [Bacillus sp. FJAT-27264]|uniref:DUF5677 domain-containing protein n=1 Tax=Paenibacillus sp. (strain DSM 101736 / FJAT-27264) TaxID=1850362 RepID=UPI000807FABE|nr:DUF5677 domain-containing protein [Bacillus sp. FJAT-27264]OBZ14640.1 hypothetical protein A8L34_12015 [Bacillus sp. FJAT-27264]